MSRWIDSLLPGSTAESGIGYPGERLGLPPDGVGAVAGLGRRVGALTVDWLIAYLLVVMIIGVDAIGSPQFGWLVLGLWFVLTALQVTLLGTSPGKLVSGTRVISVGSGTRIGVPRALLRTGLIALVLPALARDPDGRGWHDRAARTVVVRTR